LTSPALAAASAFLGTIAAISLPRLQQSAYDNNDEDKQPERQRSTHQHDLHPERKGGDD
jgi:hypothetical protein